MGKKDPRIDAYIAKSADFAKPILTHLRELVHAACPEVEETMKWSFPNFIYKGMFCSMASFKAHCAFGFWKADLIFGTGKTGTDDEKGSMGHFGRLSSISDLPKDKELLALIKEAVRLNDAGISKARPRPKVKKELVVPDYFLRALKKNKKALAAFEAFSYSHKKEYIEWITEAKTEETRQRRIAQALEWMAEGKSRNWKYANC
jgi:uncharacterized protein YdeI (YjbR/CyaY-like superfamily)